MLRGAKATIGIFVLLQLSRSIAVARDGNDGNATTHVIRYVAATNDQRPTDQSHGKRFGDARAARRATEESARGIPQGDRDYHDVERPKSKPWLGYYDFLITEGSYKFWVVFQLFTIGILIYSAFAAIYYAKYTINDYDNYDDYFLKRSARSAVPPTQTAFLGLPVETYLQIFNAIANYNDKYT